VCMCVCVCMCVYVYVCVCVCASLLRIVIIRISYRPFATTVSQLKISDFSRETFKGFEVL